MIKNHAKNEGVKSLWAEKQKQLSGIKVLGNGTLEKKLTVKANIFTNSAITKIESLGGTAEVI